MVLVLAALYSVYRSQSDSSEETISLVGKAKQAILRCSSPPENDDDDNPVPLTMEPRRLSTVMEFSPLVKDEWIDACFGRDFLRPEPDSKNFSIQVVEIPAGRGREKVGVTVSRLALGAFVAELASGSEAALAGVLVDSVLLSINDRPVLAEPTRTLLERLWQLEEAPLVLQFIKGGVMYSVVLFSVPIGIRWGPAAPHMACVQRVAGAAAAAGLKRGSLLVAVNGRTFRELDHVQTAIHMRDVFANHQTVQLTTALPSPPQSSHKQPDQRDYDGVEFKFLPMRYAIGSLCTPMAHARPHEQDIAEEVAAGRRLAPMEPPTVMRQSFESIPFNSVQMTRGWNSVQALVYCLSFRHLDYNEALFPKFDPPADPIGALHKFSKGISHFLIQFLSLVCTSTQHANELTSMLLNESRRDSVFCQRLYFMLRSFIASLEVAGQDSKNLLALLNCLEMLRFAESSVTSQQQSIKPTRRQRKAWKEDNPLDPTTYALLPDSPSTIYDHTHNFLSELDHICSHIREVLQKSVRQRITDWALQSNNKALDEVTTAMRKTLGARPLLLINPVESSEILCTMDPEQCYILPSAHFPILLTFQTNDGSGGQEQRYKTRLQPLSLTNAESLVNDGADFVIHACLAGTTLTSRPSRRSKGQSDMPEIDHTWDDAILEFTTASAWGSPNTLMLRVSSGNQAVAFGWVDLTTQWEQRLSSSRIETVHLLPTSCAAESFDEHGQVAAESQIQMQIKISTDYIEEDIVGKRLLLYKHDDDLRQEAFAVQFIQTCDDILKASGLDLKLLTFQYCPVGTRRGFVEWVPGSIPLSEICQNAGRVSMKRSESKESPPKRPVLFSRFDSMRRISGGGGETESLRAFVGAGRSGPRGSLANNPIQEYLRSVAFEPASPYFIKGEVMDTHLDNLLLHHSGSFFHCDYSFILGQDPKKYLPMRFTEQMVDGMGGKESDNYAKFLSLAGASFLSLRRPENARVLLSMVRLLEGSCLPDVSTNHTIEEAILGVAERLQLNLSQSEAITFMENLVETSISNKMWLAVDAMHNLGKRF